MRPPPGNAQGNIGLDVVFTLITCGIYGLFWQNRLFKACNALNDDEKFSFLSWFLLSLITCGIYNLVVQYQFGEALHRGLCKEGAPGNENLSLLGLLLSLFGLSIVVLAIEQHEINKLY
jgi:hypothetical protein